MANAYTATVDWDGDLAFSGVGNSGHRVVLDGAAAGEPSRGPSPVESVLLALGGCDGINVVSVLKKMRQDVTGYQLRLSAERRDEPPRIFTTIHVEHVIRGRGIDPSKVERALELAAQYCTVGVMLRQVAAVTESHTILEEPTDAGSPG